jgi:hypothetical protein
MMDEKKIREEVRRQLEEEAKRKREEQSRESSSAAQENIAAETINLSHEEQIYYYLLEGDEFRKQHPHFIVATNHLNEIRFLTALEMQQQSEYYSDDKKANRILQKKIRKKPKSVGSESEIGAYRQRIHQQLQKSLADWQEINKDLTARREELLARRQHQQIVTSETEKFYSEHPDYEKYINHLGEYRWLTREEYLQQNEYFPLQEGVVQRVRSNIGLWSVGATLLLLFLGTAIYFFWPTQEEFAYLRIESNTTDFRLRAARSNFIVEESEQVFKIPMRDSFRVAVEAYKPNYKVIHGDTTLLLVPGDTAFYRVRMRPLKVGDKLARVQLEANTDFAKIFVNRTYLGDYPALTELLLEPGFHEIQLFRDGYRNLTGTRELELEADTNALVLAFVFEDFDKVLQSKTRKVKGSIGVSSNVPNADVYVNGVLRGKTNLVLEDLPAGSYEIEVRKIGYEVMPPARQVILQEGREVASVDFSLISTSGQLVLNVRPANAPLLLNGRPIDLERFTGQLPVGEHILRPLPLQGYRTPDSVLLVMPNNGYLRTTIVYPPDIDYQFSINAGGEVETSGGLRYLLGYERLGNFIQDDKLGPELIRHPELGFGWRMGYALRFDTPPGNDGFILSLDIPSDFDLNLPVYLYWEGYKLGENYPITPVENHEIMLTVNNKLVISGREPALDETDYPAAPERIQISRFLRHGLNRLEYRLTDNNTAFYFLKRLRVH